MIAAILRNGVPVQVDDAIPGGALVTSLGRDFINQHYVGGEGYVGSKYSGVALEDLAEVALLPEQCDPLQNWIDAMDDVDRLCDEHSEATAAALEIERQAQEAFLQFIHENRLAPHQPDDEITPLSPQAIHEFDFGKGDEDAQALCSAGVALQGARG